MGSDPVRPARHTLRHAALLRRHRACIEATRELILSSRDCVAEARRSLERLRALQAEWAAEIPPQRDGPGRETRE